MAYSVSAAITPLAAAQLVMLNEIDLTERWSDSCAGAVLNAIAKLTIEDLLRLVDVADPGFLSTDEIPQFGNMSSLVRVPAIVLRDGKSGGLNYALLGFKLKNDVTAKLEANIKYGENHGKGAALLGLISIKDRRFEPSSLTSCFCSLPDDAKEQLILNLFFRIPIVQAILKEAQHKIVNGYDFMQNMSVSTKKRRGQCLRAIFQEFGSLNHDLLSQRINNIRWDTDNKGAC